MEYAGTLWAEQGLSGVYQLPQAEYKLTPCAPGAWDPCPPVGHQFPTLDRCLCNTNQREMGYLIQPHKNTRLLFLSKWEPDKGLLWRDWPRTQSAAETEEKYGTAKEYLTPAFCVVR